MAKDKEITLEDDIDFLVSVVKSYQHLFLALEKVERFYPAVAKIMSDIKPVNEKVERLMADFHKRHNRQYFPAVNARNRNN